MAGKNEAVTDFFAVISRSADPSPRCNMQVRPIFAWLEKRLLFAVFVLAPAAATVIIMMSAAAALWAFHSLFQSRLTRWLQPLAVAAESRAKAEKGRPRSFSLLSIPSHTHTASYGIFRGHGQFPQVFGFCGGGDERARLSRLICPSFLRSLSLSAAVMRPTLVTGPGE